MEEAKFLNAAGSGNFRVVQEMLSSENLDVDCKDVVSE